MGETSSYHSDSLGVGVKELRMKNYGWMLNRWRVKIYRYPVVKEKIVVETWTSSFDKFYATREFKIYDVNNNEIGKATTLWIFLDINKKRPIRIPKEFNQIYNIVDERLLHDFYDFSPDFPIEKTIDFHVRKSDIDYNNHVNNVKYLNWILEPVPDSIESNCILSEFDILYKREVTYGKLIVSAIDKGDFTGDNVEFLHKIMDSHNDSVNTYARTKWKKLNPFG